MRFALAHAVIFSGENFIAGKRAARLGRTRTVFGYVPEKEMLKLIGDEINWN